MTVSFRISREDAKLVRAIIERIERFENFDLSKRDRTDWQMDLYATNANGNRMDFSRLLAADDFNFIHDIVGIYRNLDRETGKLMNLFTPRFSRPSGQRTRRAA